MLEIRASNLEGLLLKLQYSNYRACYLHGCLNRIIISKNLAINESKS